MSYDRPAEFEKEKLDCTVRTLSTVAQIPYQEAHALLEKYGRKNGRGIVFSKVYEKVFNALNLSYKQVKRSGTVNTLIKEHPKGRIYCLKTRHAFPVIDGEAYDLDSLNSRIMRAWLITKKGDY